MNNNEYIVKEKFVLEKNTIKGLYRNPIMQGADPFVLLHNGKYYLYSTSAEDGFIVYVSDDMVNWEDNGYCLKKNDVIGEKWFWTPEVTVKDGKFYMVYTAEEHLGIAVSDSPTGPFIQREKRWLSENNAIDGHFFVDDDGAVYLYYVRFNDGNVIYVAKMNESLDGFDEKNEIFLIKADKEWELKDCKVVEGPFVLKHNGKYYLTYSANHTMSQYYAVGCAVSGSPTGPFKKYENNPILVKTNEVFGTGHHSFVRTSKTNELICVYHCHFGKNKVLPRMVCIDRAGFRIDKDGNEVLTVFGPTNTPQKAF